MKQEDFLSTLTLAKSVKNCYNNKYPYNLGYHNSDGRFSFDCWNLIKVVLSGWTPELPVGKFISASKLVTGDIDGAHILAKCHDRSKDFSKLNIPGTYLYLSSSPHSGIYIGDHVLSDGKVVNVIECTKAWGTNGVVYSYVDAKGGRYNHKGGSKALSWSEYGLLPWVEYKPDEKPTQIPSTTVETEDYVSYTVVKGDTLSRIAAKYNTTVPAIMEANPLIKDKNVIYPGQKLVIPIKTQQSSTAAKSGEKVYHLVQKGETLSGIASKYSTTYVKIAALNGIANPNKIYPGQKLRVK